MPEMLQTPVVQAWFVRAQAVAPRAYATVAAMKMRLVALRHRVRGVRPISCAVMRSVSYAEAQATLAAAMPGPAPAMLDSRVATSARASPPTIVVHHSELGRSLDVAASSSRPVRTDAIMLQHA